MPRRSEDDMGPNSSVRSAMFIASTILKIPDKLRRSDISGHMHFPLVSSGMTSLLMPLLRSLDGSSGGRTINMVLLTELDPRQGCLSLARVRLGYWILQLIASYPFIESIWSTLAV